MMNLVVIQRLILLGIDIQTSSTEGVESCQHTQISIRDPQTQMLLWGGLKLDPRHEVEGSLAGGLNRRLKLPRSWERPDGRL